MKKETLKNIISIETIIFGLLSIFFVCLSVAGNLAYSTSFVIILGMLAELCIKMYFLKRGQEEEKTFLCISIIVAVIFIISLIIRIV